MDDLEAQFATLLGQSVEPVAEPALPDGTLLEPGIDPVQSGFSMLMEQMQEDNNRSTVLALESAREANPDLYRKAREFAGVQDLPPDVAYRNIDHFVEQEKLSKLRMALEANQGLKQWFETGDNSRTVTVENLQTMSDLAWTLTAVPRAYEQGFKQLDATNIRFRQLFGSAAPEEIAWADEADSNMVADFGEDSWLSQAAVFAAGVVPGMLQTAGEGIKGAAYGGAAGGTVGSVIPGLGTAVGAVSGAGIGSSTLAVIDLFRQNTGEAFGEYLRFRSTDGKKLTHHEAAGAALIAGTLSAGLDATSLGYLLKKTGIGAALASLGPKEAIKQALKDQGFRQIAAAFGKRLAQTSLMEGGTEGIQEAIKIAAGEVVKEVSSQGDFENVGWMGTEDKPGFIPRVGEAAWQGMLATAMLGFLPLGGRAMVDFTHSRRAEEEADKFKNIIETAKKDDLVKTEPAQAATLAQAALEGTGKETIYLDTDSVREFLQADDSPEVAALSKIPEFQERLTQAVQTGGDIPIRTADFYAYVATSDAAASLIDRLKFSPEGMSKKQAKDFVASIDKAMKAQMPEAGEVQGTVASDIYTQSRAVGATPDQARTYAALYGAFFDSMASKTGRSAWDIYKAYNLKVERPVDTPTSVTPGTFAQINKKDEKAGAKVARVLARGLETAGVTVKPIAVGKVAQSRSSAGADVIVAGQSIGTLSYHPDIDRMYMSSSQAEGFGKAAYDAVEKATGHKLQPDLRHLSHEGKRFWEKRDPEQVKDYVLAKDGTHWYHPEAAKYYQDNGQVIRGAITFLPDKTVIRLFRDANLSTMLHETGHLFLQVMRDLVDGKRAFGGQLFQDDSLEIGDTVNLLDADGNPYKMGQGVVEEFKNEGGKVWIRFEGSTIWHPTDRLLLVSKKAPVEIDDAADVVDPDVMEQVVLPVPEGPEVDPTMAPSDATPPAVSKTQSDFDALRFTNPAFRRFVERRGEPKTDAARKRLVREYFPNTPAARKGRQAKIDNPLGVTTEGAAALNVDESVQRVNNVLDAVASLEKALSGRQSKNVLRMLNISIEKFRETDADMSDAIAGFEAQLAKIQGTGTLPEGVKRLVSRYITLYKKKQRAAADKEARKAKREGEQEAREGKKLKEEDVAAAITELANVVARAEKIEAAKEARQSLIEDIDTINEWLGENGPVYSVDAHEKFARGFEAYLMEGVAPNDGLRRAFERFKSWLKFVYRQITNIGVQPTPEIKAVFGRMLTIDDTLAETLPGAEFKAAFSTAEEAGMTEAEFQEYLARVDAIATVGREAAERAATTEAQKLRTQALRDKKAEIRKRVTSELEGQRVYRAIKYLQGRRMDGLDNVKLDRERVVQILGKKNLHTIPGGASIWTKAGGVDPDAVAVMFGYNSGAEMLADFQKTEPLKTVIDKRVEAEAAQLTEEQLVTPDDVAEMTAAKLRSDVYKDFLKTEIRAFAKLMGVDFTDAHAVQFQRMANDIIEARTVKNVQRRNFMKEFTEADRKIGKLLETAIRRKDYAQAMDLRRKQLFNSFLISKAYEAKETVNASQKYLKGFSKKKASVIDQAYLSQIRNMLIGLGFMPGQLDNAAASFSRFLDEEIASGSMLVVDPRLKGKMRPYQQMTVAELNAVYNAVKNMDFMGRNKRKIVKEGKKYDLNLAAAQIAASMDKFIIPPKDTGRLNPTKVGLFRRGFGKYFASLTKIEQLCDWMDGRAAQGPAHREIFQPIADAQAKEMALVHKYSARLLEVINRRETTYWASEVHATSVGKTVKRSEIMAIALNMGNESNRTKLTKGMGWTQPQVDAVLEFMDKQDWEIVQEIWDILGEFWPMVVEVNARLGRPKADAVQALPFTNKHGTWKGGYYPVVYDPDKSADVLARGIATKAEEMFGFDPHSVFPPSSFANDRDNAYARPMLLDMRVLPNHVAKITHFISHAEAVSNVQKLLMHSEIRDRMLQNFGQEMFAATLEWLNFVAKGETQQPGVSVFNKVLRGLRTNIAVAALGFRATTVIAQAGGLFSGAEKIGFKSVMSGLADMYGSLSPEQIGENFKFVREKSPEMAARTQFLDRDLQHMAEAFENPSIRRRIRDVAMAPLKAADSIVATAVWMGAYHQELARSRDDVKAVAYADKTVRLTQGSGAPKDLAAIQRGNEAMKLFTMFYTYFSSMQNRIMDIGHTARDRFQGNTNPDAAPSPNEVARVLYLIVLPTVLFDFFLKGALQGQFTDDDEDTGTLGQALWKIVGYSVTGLVGVRDIFSFSTKDGTDWKYNVPPVLRSIEMLIQRASRALQAGASDEKELKPSDMFRLGTDAAGVALGLPADAATLPVYNFLKAQETGEPFVPADFVVRR